MSEKTDNKSGGGGMGRPGGGSMGSLGMPVSKAKDFKGTLMRLLGYLRPQKFKFILVFIFAILSTVFGIVGLRF